MRLPGRCVRTAAGGLLRLGAALAATVLLHGTVGAADPAGTPADSTARGIARYREAVADSNPGELWEVRGEALWTERRGPRNVSLEGCDLGKGPGVVDGAYALLPRYFADVDRVMDLETRLLHCMMTLQGFTRAQALRRPFGAGALRSDFEALAAWIAGRSRGLEMDPPQVWPKEIEAYRLGRSLFFVRAGTHDFACHTCHGQSGRRIRLQELPDLLDPASVRAIYGSWPAYRVSQGEMRTLQWRMNDCFRQQRLPELVFGSDVSVALITFLAVNARGGIVDAPGVRR